MKIIYQRKTVFKYSAKVFSVILITKMMPIGITVLRVFKKHFFGKIYTKYGNCTNKK